MVDDIMEKKQGNGQDAGLDDAGLEDAGLEEGQSNITTGAVFGEIVWLMAQSKGHRNNFFLADLEWLLMPPITEGQFRIFRNNNKPMGAAIWAFVSPEVEKRLSQGFSKLKLADWRSGNQPWLIDIVSPFGQAEAMLEELKKTVLADYKFKCFQVNANGEKAVVEYVGLNLM